MADFQRSYSGFSVFRHGADRNGPFKDCNAHERPRLRFCGMGAATANRCAPRFPKPGSDAVFAVAAVSGIPSHIPSSPQALAQRVRTRVAASPHFLQFGPWKEKERAVRGAALSQFALQVCAFDKGLGKFHFLDKFTVDMYYKQS